MVGNNADVGITILGFVGTGRPILVGITEWLENMDAPWHDVNLGRNRAWEVPDGQQPDCDRDGPSGNGIRSSNDVRARHQNDHITFGAQVIP